MTKWKPCVCRRAMVTAMAWVLLVLGALTEGLHAQFAPNCDSERDGEVMVNLFEWKWIDIADECERYLGPKGFCGIQVSPPSEHAVVTSPNRPWWERYQPVSYELVSRSGNRTQFIDMVRRCNDVGVRIYIDAVFNQMAGGGASNGIGNTPYDPQTLEYIGIPYNHSDFNSCSKCGNGDFCGIYDNDHRFSADKVRNCPLLGLPDLDQSLDDVRQKISNYLNDALSTGVDGFRIDAAKHMWPDDIHAIVARMNPTLAGGAAYIYQEVIDLFSSDAIKSSDYIGNGAVLEFKYGHMLSDQIYNNKGLRYLQSFGSTWGMLPSDKAFVFVDNHDNQRSDGGTLVLSHRYGRPYTVALIFMLAWPYGVPQIMSSYSFNDFNQGPPSENGFTNDVPILSNGLCGGGWVCEHRWRPVGNMVAWRNAAGSLPVANWWSNGGNQIAFSRGDAAFIVINYNDNFLDVTLRTGLPAGTYCDIISGETLNGSCTGRVVHVDSNGRASLQLSGTDQDPVIAIHVHAKINDGAAAAKSNSTSGQFLRTLVFLKKVTVPGQDVFLRGGLDTSRCSDSAEKCKIPVHYNSTTSGDNYEKLNAWKFNDEWLDWSGAESGQGQYDGQQAQGSPMIWTTNASGPAYSPDNSFGDHYWMWAVDMDCSSAYQGWFELKGYLAGQWEPDVHQEPCAGTYSGSPSFASGNHIAKCGALNVFEWGSKACRVNAL